MLILGLKDIAIVERPCRDNFPLGFKLQIEVVDTDMVSECKQS